jgi:hypothetical protein
MSVPGEAPGEDPGAMAVRDELPAQMSEVAATAKAAKPTTRTTLAALCPTSAKG